MGSPYIYDMPYRTLIVNRLLVLSISGVSVLFCSIALAIYAFLFWWNRQYVNHSITRQSAVLLFVSMLFAIHTLLIVTVAHQEASCLAIGFMFRATTLMFHWMCFFTIFLIQLVVIHRVKAPIRYEIWFYFAAFILAVGPSLYTLAHRENGLRLYNNSYCGYRLFGDPRTIVIWWLTQFLWIILALVLSIVSLCLVLLKVRSNIRKLQNSTNVSLTRHRGSSGMSETQRTLADIHSYQAEYSAKVLRTLFKRLIWIQAIPAITQLVYIFTTIIDFAANTVVSSVYYIGHILLVSQGALMAIIFCTEPRVRVALRAFKDDFFRKWYNDQKAYWNLHSRCEQEPRRESMLQKPNQNTDTENTSDNSGTVISHSSKAALHRIDLERRPEFESLRGRVAYYICKKFLA